MGNWHDSIEIVKNLRRTHWILTEPSRSEEEAVLQQNQHLGHVIKLVLGERIEKLDQVYIVIISRRDAEIKGQPLTKQGSPSKAYLCPFKTRIDQGEILDHVCSRGVAVYDQLLSTCGKVNTLRRRRKPALKQRVSRGQALWVI